MAGFRHHFYHWLVLCGVLLAVTLAGVSPAFATDPTPTPSPEPTSSAAPSSAPVDVATNGGIWASANDFFIYCEDAVLGWLPETPGWMKLSSLVTALHTGFPLAPWYLLHQFFAAFTFVAGALVVFKAIKLFWP